MLALKRAVFLSFFGLFLVLSFFWFGFALFCLFFLSFLLNGLKRAVFSDCFYKFASTFLGFCSSPVLFHIFPFLLLSALCSCHQCADFHIDFRYFFYFRFAFFTIFCFFTSYPTCEFFDRWRYEFYTRNPMVQIGNMYPDLREFIPPTENRVLARKLAKLYPSLRW